MLVVIIVVVIAVVIVAACFVFLLYPPTQPCRPIPLSDHFKSGEFGVPLAERHSISAPAAEMTPKATAVGHHIEGIRPVECRRPHTQPPL